MKGSNQDFVETLARRVDQLEQRNRRLRNGLSVAVAAGLLLMAGAGFQYSVRDVQANVLKDLGADIKAMNSVLTDLAAILHAVNTPENLKAMNQVDDLINEAHGALVDDEEGIAMAVRELRTEMRQMNHNMHVMTVNMARMSSTVTPAMGRMGDMMRIMPVP
mgnify:CR=1 FL=1